MYLKFLFYSASKVFDFQENGQYSKNAMTFVSSLVLKMAFFPSRNA